MLSTYPVLSNGEQACLFHLIKNKSMLLNKQAFKRNSFYKANRGSRR